MVAPIVGPTLTLISQPDIYDYKVVTKQARPIDRVLPYERKFVTSKKLHATYGSDAAQLAVYDSVHRAHCLNQAYERLKNKLGDKAELGIMLAESRQSANMITRRLYEVGAMCTAIAKKDFQGARRIVNLMAVPSGVSVKKSFANNFLEFHFGWSPLISDIFAALDVLSNQQLASFISGSSQTPYLSVNNSGGAYTQTKDRVEGVVRVRMGAKVDYVNKNLDMLNRLGLLNPASVAWELVPFSFVVDWFVNVNQMCSLMTDFIGLSLSWTYTTYSWRVAKSYYSSNWFDPNNITSSGSQTNGVYVKRVVGLDKPTFKVKPFNIGIGRAATAAALVVQRLHEKGYKDLGYKLPPKRYYNWGFSTRP